jgi:hypothetical protein
MNSECDKKIKAMIECEHKHIPVEFKNKISLMLEELPKDNDGLKKEKKTTSRAKFILIASIVALFFVITAFTIPGLLQMTQNFIKEFYNIDNLNIASKQQDYEEFNAPVSYTSTDEDISVTINNIALDGNFLLITSTITGPVPIKDIITGSPRYKWEIEKFGTSDYLSFIYSLAPYYSFKIDGKDLGIFDMTDWDDYLESDYSFVTIQKYMIPGEIPDVFNLSVSANNICNTMGIWDFDIMIDKSNSNENSITVTPNIKAEVTSIVQGAEYKHNITINKLSISPFGGQITLSESGSEVFRDFVLRDMDNNYYLVFNNSVMSSGNENIIKQAFEFIYPSANREIEELELVPILTYGTPVEKQVMLSSDNTPTELKISDIGGYKTENIEINDKEIKVVLKQYGAILQYRSITNGAFGFIDKKGSKEINKYISKNEVKYDKKNGNAVITGYWSEDAPDNIFDQIGGFWYVETPDMQINENEIIKIPLK